MQKTKFIVLTGGPGAGKTAVLEAARQIFTDQIMILPEAASIVYSGGFPREDSVVSRRSSQRAIFRIQEELEKFTLEDGKSKIVLCDRGIADGAAYWPDGYDLFFEAIGIGREQIFARYDTVIHLRTPSFAFGYTNKSNPMRIETPEEAAELDRRTEIAWLGHPNHHLVEATETFTEKLDHVTGLISEALVAPFDFVEREQSLLM